MIAMAEREEENEKKRKRLGRALLHPSIGEFLAVIRDRVVKSREAFNGLGKDNLNPSESLLSRTM